MKPLKNGELTTADRLSALSYLFDRGVSKLGETSSGEPQPADAEETATGESEPSTRTRIRNLRQQLNKRYLGSGQRKRIQAKLAKLGAEPYTPDSDIAGTDDARTTIRADGAKHWREWLPKMTRELEAEGILNETAQTQSKLASRRIAELMQAGYQVHEAEEVVLPEEILWPPEAELPYGSP